MGNYLETVRSAVPAWELDTVEHFTVAYYFERFARAGARMVIEAGHDPASSNAPRTLDCYVRYARELRGGDQFHIDSGVISIDQSADRWTVGHKLIDSTTNEVCTTLEQTFDGSPVVDVSALTVEWDGPERELRAAAQDGDHWVATGTDVLRPTEMDWRGRLDLSGFIHRFSSANEHLETMFGMSGKYMRDNRIGFSTFEFQLDFPNPAPLAGEIVETQSCVAHVGRSSFRMLHRMNSRSSGDRIAQLSIMGVHLDLDARRPKAMPDAIRESAKAMMA